MQKVTGICGARSAPASTFGSIPVRSAVTGDAHSRGVEFRRRDRGVALHGAPADVDGKRRRRDRHRRTSVRRSGARLRHSLDRCCRSWCKTCRTFQKSSVNRVVRPRRDGMPGTLLPESGRGMSSRTTRASPKRCDTWLAPATAVTGASAFRRPDMMADRLRREDARRYGWRMKFRQEALQGLHAQDAARALAFCSGRRHCGRGRGP